MSTGVAVHNVTVAVPSETWEGEAATMTCTFPNIARDEWRLKWYKGSSIQLYLYMQIPNEVIERSYNDLTDRCVGWLDGNVHTLYINSTTVADEDTYTCSVSEEEDSKMLRVNGEYS